ncbi:hypothetical protein TNCV_635411 [Trichonephila clavipes]|nr:hypothetical protein TNCV_635411 [Trichonephila clavipes]
MILLKSRTRRSPHCGRGPGPEPSWPMPDDVYYGFLCGALKPWVGILEKVWMFAQCRVSVRHEPSQEFSFAIPSSSKRSAESSVLWTTRPSPLPSPCVARCPYRSKDEEIVTEDRCANEEDASANDSLANECKQQPAAALC